MMPPGAGSLCARAPTSSPPPFSIMVASTSWSSPERSGLRVPEGARASRLDRTRCSRYATAIPLVVLLELVWDIPPSRLASELDRLGIGSSFEAGLAELTEPERATVAELIAVLGARHRKRPTDGGPGRSR
jgi:hypothetical protein